MPAADPAGNKQSEKHHMHFVLSRRRASRDFHQILHDDRGGPYHHFTPQTFLGPIHSFVARGRKNLAKTPPSK